MPNVSVLYEAVRYHVNRYRNCRIDENMLDNIDEQSNLLSVTTEDVNAVRRK